MKPGHKILALVMFFATVCLGFAGWNERAREYASTYSTPYKDGFLSSLAATCNLKRVPYKKMVVNIEKWEVFSPEMEKGKLKVDVGLQRDAEGKVLRAPLAIYIPGSFVNLNDKQSNRWLNSLTRLGYHTVVFPNPFGTDFIKQVPISKFGTVTEEAKTVYGMIRRAFGLLRQMGALDGSVRIIGVSSGGFFTAAVAALDAEHKNPIITTDATILAPGFHLGRGMDRLDEYVEEQREPYQEMWLLRMYVKLRKICRMKDPSNPSEKVLRDSRGIVTFAGFYEELVNSVKRYDKTRSLNKVPKKGKALGQWRDRFAFSVYYDEFNPEGEKIIRGEHGHLYYWLGRAYKAGFPSIRVLTTTDDFFNDPGVWGDMKSNPLMDDALGVYGLMNDEKMWSRIQKDLIVLNHGGHYGFRSNPWFENFIRIAFGNNRPEVSRKETFKNLYLELEMLPFERDSLFRPLR
jgi:hypothetical protein